MWLEVRVHDEELAFRPDGRRFAPLCGVVITTSLSERLIRTAPSVPLGVREVWPPTTVRLWPPGSMTGIGPAEHPLVPQAHVGRQGLEDRAGVRTARHEISSSSPQHIWSSARSTSPAKPPSRRAVKAKR